MKDGIFYGTDYVLSSAERPVFRLEEREGRTNIKHNSLLERVSKGMSQKAEEACRYAFRSDSCFDDLHRKFRNS